MISEKIERFLTFFVPSQISTSLGFLKFFGVSYALDVVLVGSLHLEGGQMTSGKIEIQKILDRKSVV